MVRVMGTPLMALGRSLGVFLKDSVLLWARVGISDESSAVTRGLLVPALSSLPCWESTVSETALVCVKPLLVEKETKGKKTELGSRE